MTENSLAQDLDHIIQHTEPLWENIRGQHLLITGGTGFVGCWLLESFVWANDLLSLNAKVSVLTRDPAAFNIKAPHLAGNGSVTLHRGDIRTSEMPHGKFYGVIHAATDADAVAIINQPIETLRTIIEGTHRVLDHANRCGAKRFLLLSSGAVYGIQPSTCSKMSEDYTGGPELNSTIAPYAEGKRVAELFTNLYAMHTALETVIARCFTFVGPYLDLGRHFAVANFIGNGLRNEEIKLTGDGSAIRSYLYAADMAIWLWSLFFTGSSGQAYNVGSENEITIYKLAHTINQLFGKSDEISIHRSTNSEGTNRYIPSTTKAQSELSLREYVSLTDALSRTIIWHRGRDKEKTH